MFENLVSCSCIVYRFSGWYMCRMGGQQGYIYMYRRLLSGSNHG